MDIKLSMIPISKVRARGWSDSLISLLLAEPDAIRPNPHYRCGPPMRLYCMDRVQNAECDTRWKRYQERRQRLSTVAKGGIEKRRTAMLAWAATVSISVPVLSKNEIEKKSLAHWFDRLANRHPGHDFPDHRDSTWRARIAVNYLRHVCTNYEDLLDNTFGQVGRNTAYAIIKKRVLRELAARYDWLADECYIQEAQVLTKDDIRERRLCEI